jgi:hypothetical protein
VPEEYTVDAQGNKTSNLTSFQTKNKNVKDYLSNTHKDANADQLSWLSSYGEEFKTSYMTKDEYLDYHADQIAAGTHTETYA